MKQKIDMRKLDVGERMILKDVREMCDFVEKYAIRSGGIQSDKYIDSIQEYIRKLILTPAMRQ